MYCIQKKGRKSMKYVVPELEIVELDVDDVIRTSDGMGNGGSGNMNDDDVGGSVTPDPETPWD